MEVRSLRIIRLKRNQSSGLQSVRTGERRNVRRDCEHGDKGKEVMSNQACACPLYPRRSQGYPSIGDMKPFSITVFSWNKPNHHLGFLTSVTPYIPDTWVTCFEVHSYSSPHTDQLYLLDPHNSKLCIEFPCFSLECNCPSVPRNIGFRIPKIKRCSFASFKMA